MIRQAEPADAEQVVPLIIQAMGHLAVKFANSDKPEVITRLFTHFFKEKANQYSYQNTLVYLADNEILGAINAYDGAKLQSLKSPFLVYLSENHGLIDFKSENEAESDEFYLDTISVNAKAQGKGIGKALINAGIDWAKKLGHVKTGLLVEPENIKALKLYQHKGFEIENEKEFMGGKYYHMTYKIEKHS